MQDPERRLTRGKTALLVFRHWRRGLGASANLERSRALNAPSENTGLGTLASTGQSLGSVVASLLLILR